MNSANGSTGYQYDWLIFLGVMLFGVLVVAIKRWFLKYRTPDIAQTPVLLSYFTQGNDLISASKTDLPDVTGGATCNRMITMPRHDIEEDLKVPSGTVLLFIDLPFRSKLHLLAIAKDDKFDQLNPTFGDSVMERVVLEGDFPDYFSLYADKGEQVQARYIVDPSTMEFVVDFCKKYHWEILDDGLCFAAKAGLPDNSTITEFIKQIRPIIEIPKEPSKYKANQNQKVYPAASQFKCPICHETMIEHKYWHECAKGHGQLMDGGAIVRMKENENTDQEKPSPNEVYTEHKEISCPSCSQKMEPTKYAGSKIIIDVCRSCKYRWLDGGELEKIVDGKDRV